MSGVPLHPLVVHFPVVLSVLLPLVILVALWVIARRGVAPLRAWLVPLAFAAALTASAFVATRTGEAEEDRVERVVGERALHDHEEAGERFLIFTAILLGIAATGLLPGLAGRAGRIVTAVGAVAIVAAGVQVGHSGGTLVYQHGAASAYTDQQPGGVTPAGAPRSDDDDH